MPVTRVHLDRNIGSAVFPHKRKVVREHDGLVPRDGKEERQRIRDQIFAQIPAAVVHPVLGPETLIGSIDMCAIACSLPSRSSGSESR